MDCAVFESTLADYLDGTLDPAGRAALELHLAECAGCREFMHEVNGGLTVLADLQEAEPPQELFTRLAFLAPQGKTRDRFDEPGFWTRLKIKWLEPMLQPRLVMGMAMTVLSFAMLEKCTGVQVQHVQSADLDPVRVLTNLEDKAVRAKDRLVKNYENLRVVYEIESRLTEVERQNAADAQTQSAKEKAGPAKPSSGNNANSGNKPDQGEQK